MPNRKKADPHAGSGPRASNKTDNKVHEHIGSQLRRLFNGVVEEPIPDKLRSLLEELDQTDEKKPE